MNAIATTSKHERYQRGEYPPFPEIGEIDSGKLSDR
jgi:hypothetical protein